MDPNDTAIEEDESSSQGRKEGLSRGQAFKTTAKVGLAAGAAGLLGEGSLISALAATKDTMGNGKFTGWAGLSQGEVNVLRMIVEDPQFRAQFIKSPKLAIKSSGQKLTPAQITNLSRANKLQVENFAANVQASVAAGTAGTHTLIYAIVFAVVVCLLFAAEGQEGSPTGGGAVPIF